MRKICKHITLVSSPLFLAYHSVVAIIPHVICIVVSKKAIYKTKLLTENTLPDLTTLVCTILSKSTAFLQGNISFLATDLGPQMTSGTPSKWHL